MLLTTSVIFIIELPAPLPETFRNLPECKVSAMHLRRPLAGPTCQVSCLQVKDICDVQVGTQVTLFNWQAHQCFQLGDREKQSSKLICGRNATPQSCIAHTNFSFVNMECL